jgi:hypothetical protein
MGQPAPRRRSPWPVVALAVGALALLGGGTAAGMALAGHRSTPAAPAAVTITTVPASPATTTIDSPAAAAPKPLTENAACVALVPVLDRAVTLALAFAKDPGSVTETQAEAVYTDLSNLYGVVPADMRADLDAQMTPLRDVITFAQGGQVGTVSFEQFRASGERLATRCRKYAK